MIQEHITDLCTYWPPGTKDAYGVASYGEPKVLPCRIRKKMQQIRTKEGKEETSDITVLLLEDIDIDGKIYLGADSWYWIVPAMPIPRTPDEIPGDPHIYEPKAVKDIREGTEAVAWRVYL